MAHEIETKVLGIDAKKVNEKLSALVSTHLYDTCHTMLTQKGKYRRPSLKPFLYRGLITCGRCGCAITFEVQKTNHYLRCTKSKGTCDERYLRQADAQKQVKKLLQQIVLPQSTIDEWMTEANALQTAEVSAFKKNVNAIRDSIDVIDTKLQRHVSVYVEGSMSLEKFNNAKEQLLKTKRSFVEKLEFIQTHRETPLEPMIQFIHGLTEARIVAQGDNAVLQRDLLQKAASNLKLTHGILTGTFTGPWKTVAASARFARRTSRTANASAPTSTFCSSECSQ